MIRALAAPVIAATLSAGCGVSTVEQQTIRLFFEAARTGDKTLLAKVATVTMNPITEGTVRDFEVTEVREERSTEGVLTKQVVVSAQVDTASTRTSRTMVLTLQRTAGPESAAPAWRVTALR